MAETKIKTESESMLKMSEKSTNRTLFSSLFLNLAFYKNMKQGELEKVECENPEKERYNKVDWCNPLYPGTKGSNSNGNMSK